MENFGVVNGRVITCSEAAQFRDNVLIRQYDALMRDYDAGKEQRRQQVLTELTQHLDNAEGVWSGAEPILRKRIFGQLAAMAVAVGANKTAGWASARSGLSGTEAAVAGELYQRSAYVTEKISSAAYTAPDISPVDIAQMSAGLFIAVAGTVVMSEALFFSGLAYGAIQTWGAVSDYIATKNEYEGDVATMRRAIEGIATKSVDGQIRRLLNMANDIAASCGGPERP